MKFHTLGLTTAAAVLASIVSAGAYTTPAPHIATPVGGGADGYSFYIGGALSQVGGSVLNTQSTTAITALTTNTSAAGVSGAITTAGVASTAAATAGSYSALTYTEALTVSALKFGGEGHLGAYFGVAEGFGFGIEAFGVTRTSFNPTSSIKVVSNTQSNPASVVTSNTPGTTASQAAGSNTGNGISPTVNTLTAGLDIKPNSLGYGFRVMPTVMISDQFGMFASIGYGSQKFKGTLTNSDFSHQGNLAQTGLQGLGDSYYAIGTSSITGAISKNLTGVNYGFGSFFNVDETISIFSGFEVQKFKTYDVTSLNTSVKTGATTPTPVVSATAGLATAPAWKAVTTTATGSYVTGTTTIADASSASSPSSIKIQLNTFSVGVDYAFV